MTRQHFEALAAEIRKIANPAARAEACAAAPAHKQAAPAPQPQADVRVSDHGSIWLLTPVSDAGREWLAEHIDAGAQRWGANSLVVEHRYVASIVDGIVNDGLAVI